LKRWLRHRGTDVFRVLYVNTDTLHQFCVEPAAVWHGTALMPGERFLLHCSAHAEPYPVVPFLYFVIYRDDTTSSYFKVLLRFICVTWNSLDAFLLFDNNNNMIDTVYYNPNDKTYL